MGSYFNTYYNAQRLFSEAEEEVLSARENKESALSAVGFTIQPPTKTKFTSVIEKCSKLLQYHPESSFLEGAVMMIGKSYYYQNDYQKAERKFTELLEGYPQSSYRFEAKLLLARTYYRMNEKGKAGTAAKELAEIASQEGNSTIASDASVLLGAIELENKNLSAARAQYQRAADIGVSAGQRTQAYLKVAEIYIEQGDYRNALEAYRNAEDESDDYTSEYRAQIGQARLLTKLGKLDAALSLLEDMVSNSNNRDFYGEISLEIGNVYAAKDDLQTAIAQYMYVDTTYARTEAAANSYYQLGLIFEDKLFLYDSARTAYNKGRNELPTAAVTPLLSRRAEYMNKYSAYRTEIARYDTIREYLLTPRDTTHAHDSLTTKNDSTTSDVLLDETGAEHGTLKPKKRVIPDIPLDTVEARLAYNKIELASLFYGTIGKVDSAKEWYQRVLAEHPKCPYVSRAMFALAQIRSQDSTGHSAAEVDSMYREIIRQFPESEFASESKRLLGIAPTKKTQDEAARVYASAERLMDEGKTEAAIDTFTSVVRNYPESPLASKAMYSVGWLYEEVEARPDSAIASYKKLVELYPKSEYAVIVRPKLSEVDLEGKGKDSTKAVVPPEEGEKKVGRVDGEDMPRSDSTRVKKPNERGDPPPEIPEKKKEPPNPKP